MIRKNLRKGLFITFEGGEGSGKTSLLEALFKQLSSSGYDTIQTRAPGGTPLGKKVRELVLHTSNVPVSQKAEVLLFLSDRAQHVDEIIKPALNRCCVVLCDRFTDSTMAYQGVSRGSLDIQDVKMLADFAASNLKPNITFYLDIDPEVGLKRAQAAIKTDGKASYDRVEGETLEFHKKVREAYLDIASKDKSRVKVIDASKSKESVQEETLKIIQAELEHLC